MDRNGGEIVRAGVRHTFPKAHCNSKLKCIDGRVLWSLRCPTLQSSTYTVTCNLLTYTLVYEHLRNLEYT